MSFWHTVLSPIFHSLFTIFGYILVNTTTYQLLGGTLVKPQSKMLRTECASFACLSTHSDFLKGIKRERLFLSAIVLLSAILNLANIGIEGTSNPYYAAGVKSMTMNLKNFFFVAMDPAGFVTVDKPPLGFWIQAIFAKVFGFSGWSILLPQALAGVLSVIVCYRLVKKTFGSTAGLLSSLFLAVTPVFVAVSRNNTIDNQLVLVLLLACLALTNAMQKGTLKPLILAMVLVGVGFNIKQLQAYMILPAIYLTYLLATTISLKKRLLHLSLGTVVLLAVSFSWAIVVDLIPESARPYVGSSAGNSELELILGHNGTERLSLGSSTGQGHSSNGAPSTGNRFQNGSKSQDKTPPQTTTKTQRDNPSQMGRGTPPQDGQTRSKPDNMGGGPDGQSSSTRLTGTFGAQTTAGLSRFFSKNILSDQIVWFLPLAFLGFMAVAMKERLKFKLDTPKKQLAVLLFMWLFPEFVYFSFTTGLFHPHYLTMMAPPAAALSGIGIVSLWSMYKKECSNSLRKIGTYKAFLLPVSLCITGAVQLLMLSYFYDSSTYIKYLVIGLILLCFCSALLLLITVFLKNKLTRIRKPLVGFAVIGLLLSPLTGSAAAIVTGVGSNTPCAGLELLSSSQSPSQSKSKAANTTPDLEKNTYTDLIEYINNVADNGSIQLVVCSATTSESITLNSDLNVASLTGFMGNETVMSLDRFKSLVNDGTIRFVLTGGNDNRGNSNNEILTWVKENGTEVNYSTTQTTTSQLYDLSGTRQ